MMQIRPKHRRMAYLLALGVVIALAVGLVLSAFRDNMQFFTSPSALAQNPPPGGKQLRLGGMVVADSIRRGADLRVDFRLTDYRHEIPVTYTGPLPDLFKENSGAVVIGTLGADGVFVAETLMARHDENYMPPEVYEALKNQTPPAR
jgi:cytochrome c-type biogenesis protein CcmE